MRLITYIKLKATFKFDADLDNCIESVTNPLALLSFPLFPTRYLYPFIYYFFNHRQKKLLLLQSANFSTLTNSKQKKI